jgi:hypothetical protein
MNYEKSVGDVCAGRAAKLAKEYIGAAEKATGEDREALLLRATNAADMYEILTGEILDEVMAKIFILL